MSFLLLLWWMSDFCLEKRTETYGGFSMKLVLFSFPLWPRDKTAAMLCSPLLFQRILRESDVLFLMDYCINWIFSVHFVLCHHFKIIFFLLWKKNFTDLRSFGKLHRSYSFKNLIACSTLHRVLSDRVPWCKTFSYIFYIFKMPSRCLGTLS